MKFNLMNIVATISAVLALIGGILAADSRYTKTEDLTLAKNEIIDEMRREVTTNRGVMIKAMIRDADDIEFLMEDYKAKGETPPRYLIEKHKQILRQIEDLQNVDKKKDKE